MIGVSTVCSKAARGLLLTLLTLAFLPFASPANSDHPDAIEESAVKGAFLHYFFHLIRWPIENDDRTFAFCFVDESSVNTSLREIIALKKSNSFSVDFTPISTPNEAASCDYVFIDSQSRSFALPIIYTTSGRPILTVSDVEGFAEAGGVIELKREGKRIIVRINVEALDKQGLGASSRLLALAERISNKGGYREDNSAAE